MSAPMTTHQLIAAKGIVPAADWRAAGRRKGSAVLAAKGKARRERIVALAAAGAGFKEIMDTTGLCKATVYNCAKNTGVPIPSVKGCRPYTSKQENRVTTIAPAMVPSVSAIKAQAAMFRLIDQHFDADRGSYAAGYDDARIAKESGLALAMVTAFRREGFGKLREMPELASIRADVASIRKMLCEIEARLAKATGE